MHFNISDLYNVKISKAFAIRGMIFYSCIHYVSVFYYYDEEAWVMFNDTIVDVIGDYYEVLREIIRRKYTPVGIFYEVMTEDMAP